MNKKEIIKNKSIKNINYVLVALISAINIFFYLNNTIKIDEIYFVVINVLLLLAFYFFNKEFENDSETQKDNIKKICNISFSGEINDMKELLLKKNKYKENNDTYKLFKNILIRKNLLEKDYEDLRGIMNKFIPKGFIKEINKIGTDRVSLGLTQKRKLNIMFLDIIGFTSLTEKLPSDKAFLLLNVYLDGIVEIIRSKGGYIDKFLGDGLMCIFDKDKTDEAIEASIEIQNFINKFQISEIGKKISIGIGINYGDVILGTIGSKERMEITIIGDTVNTASRIESLTRTSRDNIIITKSVLNNIKNQDYFSVKDIGFKMLKGKKQKMYVYGVKTHINKAL